MWKGTPTRMLTRLTDTSACEPHTEPAVNSTLVGKTCQNRSEDGTFA